MSGWGWSVLTLAALGLIGIAGYSIRTLIKSYVDQRIKARFDAELEGVRSDLRLKESKITALQSNVLSGRAGRQALLDAKRIEAAEGLWKATIDYDRFTMAVQMFGVVKVAELAKAAVNNTDLREVIDVMTGTRGEDLKTVIPTREFERFRPYIPDDVWKVFQVYTGLVMYCVMRLKTISLGLENSEKMFNEKGMTDLIKEVMPHMTEYLDKYDVAGFAHLSGPLRDLVLKSVRSVIFNDQADIDNLVASGGIMKALEQMDAAMGAEIAQG